MSFAGAIERWSEPLPREERDRLLNSAADQIVKRGLEAPSLWALEMHKPFAYLGAQALIVSAPSLAPLIGLERMQTLGRILTDQGSVEALIERIEELSAERDRTDSLRRKPESA